MKTQISKRHLISFSFIICYLSFSTTLFTSCKDDDDLTDPAARFAEAATKYQDILTAAPNGWAMAIYGDMDFGGFNVLCKFEADGKVTVANEMFTEKSGADTTAVTHYKLEQSGGVLLSFDEYCELFHYFADPLNSDGYNSETEHGFGADLEFRIISASADSVVMRGKKHNAKIMMLPVDTAMTWSAYLTQVQTVAKTMQRGSYHMTLGTDTLKLKANRRNRVFTYTTTDSTGLRETNSLPYVITPKGITFNTPFVFNGKAVRGFNYADGTEKYEQDGSDGVTLEKFTPALNEQLVDGNWFITKEGLGTFATNYWNRFVSSMLNAANCKLFYAVVGTWRRQFGLSIGPVDVTEPSGVYIGEAYFNYEMDGEDGIKIWFDGESFDEIGNGEYFYENANFRYAIFPFAGTSEKSPRTFTIETDDAKNPTYLRLRDKATSSNVITLSAEEQTWPFGGLDN